MNILISGVAHQSYYLPVYDELTHHHDIYVFKDDISSNVTLSSNTSSKFSLLDGSTKDILSFESTLQKVNFVVFFLARPEENDNEWIQLFEEVKLTIDVCIEHKKPLLIISDGNKEVIALSGSQPEAEWRPNSKHSNWVRLQYLIEQEIERANAEELNASIIWHTPIQKTSDVPTKEQYDNSEYLQLSCTIIDLVHQINDSLISFSTTIKVANSLVISELLPTTEKPVLEKKKNFFQQFFSKTSKRSNWNIIAKSNPMFSTVESLIQKNKQALS